MSERRTQWTYDEFLDLYDFDLMGEWGESNEIFHDDPRLSDMLEAGRVVSIAQYETDDDEGYIEYVYLGWARVDVLHRVLMPEGWRTHKHDWQPWFAEETWQWWKCECGQEDHTEIPGALEMM